MAEQETTSEFAVGTVVKEHDSVIVGEVIGRGDFEPEWRVRLACGTVISCLAENLSAVEAPDGEPSAGRGWHLRFAFLSFEI